MSRTTVSDLEPGSRAVLSLLLTQGKTYGQIAKLLSIDSADVRARAQTAAAALADDRDSAPDPARRALIADYLLGQQDHAQRVRTCELLSGSRSDSSWAIRLRRALSPLSTVPLATIPGAELTLLRRRVAGAAGVVAAAAVVVAVVLSSSSSGNKLDAAAALPRIPTTRGAAGAKGRTVQRLVLLPAGSDKRAFGAGAVLSQGTSMLLLLEGKGLEPNRHNSYGVWLFNTPGDAQLLGFISPQVGKTGSFSSGTTLPGDAVRFHSVVVTSETKQSPSAPGAIVMRAKLSFS